ncbi:LacI family DNA-binding transcriptional regulator [Streptomyces sp. ODS28]|uniref:LacI family DNA-binding transcriptional regulator n=1 Tax=Streptomyces sp. ODS28 TaxID=3136688 RepID=UPI0031EA99E3
MVTSRDVARLAGVSQATVSRVLQGSSSVSEGTAERVRAAMQETGYRPHAAARTMRTSRTATVGVVVSDITNPFYPQLLEAVAESLERAGQRMVLWNAAGSGQEGALAAMQERTVDGLIFTAATDELPAGADAAGPVVLLHRGLENSPYDQVTTDNVQGGRLVADYLAGTGHRRIGYLAGPPRPSTSRDRERGFTDRLGEHGLPLDPRLTAYGGFDHGTARAAMRELLSLPEPPTAVFCANDLTALGALDAAVSLGRRVPEDVWVIGYDDIAMASWDSFALTTVRQPTVEMSRAAVRLLLERMENPQLPPRSETFPSELVVRGSSAYVELGG